MKRYQAIVLLSGGQDSTTCLYYALKRHTPDEVLALSVDYGQRHRIELDASEQIATYANVDHVTHSLGVIGDLNDSALVSEDGDVHGDGREDSEGTLPATFVPGRNLMFLGLASMVAVKHGARTIYTGTCETDYSGYPDCRRSFIDSMEAAATEAMPSSCGPLKIETPLMWLTKAQTVTLAKNLGHECWHALGMSVTCYKGQRPGCGTCPSCMLRAQGFMEAGELDPANTTPLL